MPKSGKWITAIGIAAAVALPNLGKATLVAEPTRELILQILNTTCNANCSLTTTKIDNLNWKIILTQDHFDDDSVKATQIQMVLVNTNGQWQAKDQITLFKCQKGRGQQDFLPTLCL